ncbi:MAG: hypothetical protein CML04_06830 [Pseudozobellia sp.]|nr:hypothetical protein [Pseudozobellia sp.]MBG50060.1 hypothetical protein [Pseudozobellia sp.]|tara:strand:- start:648900 stop:649466 length:567 start_codon:yes stop_codon:yes gene_type:complete
MKTVLHIKNMVCDRCKLSVSQTLNSIGLEVDSIDLGMVGIIHSGALDLALVDKKLRTTGFHLIAQKDEVQIELIKAALIDYVNLDREAEELNISDYLAQRMARDYSYLSKLFSKKEATSIEKYVIGLKLEKAKELIQMNELNFSEIAYSLGYKSSSHLAKQFKAVIGMSMTKYRSMGEWHRKPLDQIL